MKKYILTQDKIIPIRLWELSHIIMKMTGGNTKYIYAVSHTPADQRPRYPSSLLLIISLALIPLWD